ncbi:MAG: hypothetical protein ACRC33_00580 [Gemmataceae bacterium]
MSRPLSLLLLLAAIPAAAAKAPLGINLAGVADWSTELVFVDQFRAARAWVSQAEGKPWGQGGPLDVDVDGNLKSLKPGQYAETVLWTDLGTPFPEGKFVCLYAGDGDVAFGGDAHAAERAPGRVVVDVKAKGGTASLRVTRTSPKDPVRDIRFLHPGHEKTYRDRPFHPELLKRWEGCRAVRFLDWQRTNDSKLSAWADRPTGRTHSAALKGVSVEELVAFSNVTKMHPWFCVPHLATDGYVREFAKLVKANLDPALTVHLEYSNECWNGQFAQARHCADQGAKLGLSGNRYEGQLRHYAQRSVEVFDAFEKEFGKDRLVRVLAVQSANPWTGTTVLGWKDAHRKADAVAIAPYFGNRFGGPKTADAVAAMSVEELLKGLGEDLDANRKVIATYAAMAKGRKLRLFAYEGGQHLAGYGGAENRDDLTKLFHAANRHPRMKGLYLKDYRQWGEAGGDLFMVFSSVGRPSKWGSWGQLESFAQKTAPKYEALREHLGR